MGRTNPSSNSVALREALLLDAEDEWVRSKCFTHSKGYAQLQVEGRRVLLHRYLLGEPDWDVDHRDGNKLNCRKGNLRPTSRPINTINTDKARSNTGHKGVSFVPRLGKYQARIMHQYQNHNLGLHRTLEEAIQARLTAERDLFGVSPRREQAFKEAGL